MYARYLTLFILHVANYSTKLLFCIEGIQEEAFQELQSHQGDPNYENVALTIDGMALKELVEFDPNLGRSFGTVDFGGNNDFGNPDTPCNEALVFMLVGLKAYWKLPIAYFLVKGTSGGFVAGKADFSSLMRLSMSCTSHLLQSLKTALHSRLLGIVREVLDRTFRMGIKVWTVTMDGAQHNVATFNALGASMMPQNMDQRKTSFPHPSEEANYDVSAVLDPPHMMKLLRTTLADFKEFHWQGVGIVK